MSELYPSPSPSPPEENPITITKEHINELKTIIIGDAELVKWYSEPTRNAKVYASYVKHAYRSCEYYLKEYYPTFNLGEIAALIFRDFEEDNYA
jgi:hypothetical protein